MNQALSGDPASSAERLLGNCAVRPQKAVQRFANAADGYPAKARSGRGGTMNEKAGIACASDQWWWLSFADETSKLGSRSLGIAIVQGRDNLSAVAMSHELGINSGGSILLVSIAANRLPAPENRNRLLSPADARELAASMNTRVLE